MFTPATKQESRLRLGLCGTSGSGKTYSALAIATALGGKVAVVDTEHGSAAKYSDVFAFDVLNLTSFEPEKFITAIRAAEKAGYATIVLDSLSHAWMGTGGTLDQVEEAKRRNPNSFTAWRDPSKQHTELIESILHSRLHVIATMRSKTEYIMEESQGKKVPKKVGMAPVQRDGMEYEFDVVGDMQAGVLVISKTRCPALADKSFHHPGAEFAGLLSAWLGGAPAPVVPTGPSAEAKERFRLACEAAGCDVKNEWREVITYYNAPWGELTDADLDAYAHTLTPIDAAS
jgi:nucleoside-triphosphatase THEP1